MEKNILICEIYVRIYKIYFRRKLYTQNVFYLYLLRKSEISLLQYIYLCGQKVHKSHIFLISVEGTRNIHVPNKHKKFQIDRLISF